MPSLLAELRRRNVFRVGVAYLAFAWLLIEITDTVAPPLGLPDGTLTLVIWLALIGLPVALLFAWAFELTPDGILRTEDVEPSRSITTRTAGRLNVAIIVLLLCAVAVLLIDRFWVSGGVTEETGAFDSIAVLPFVNLSDDPKNAHFGDALAEELMNLLAKVDGLKVAARTSSFYFKDKDTAIGEIADALDVDTIVEGSVRRSNDTVRVVVQLISADTNAQLWSGKYDRPLTDLFEVQDDIANRIVTELMPQLGAAAGPIVSSNAADISPDVFERFLLARRKYHDGTDASVAEARDDFLAVTKAAPAYAPGWAWLARAWLSLEGRSSVDVEVARKAAEEAIATAITLDPENAMTYVARGRMYLLDEENTQALENFDHAIKLDPNIVDAYIGREEALFSLGQANAAIDALERARSIDPLHPDVLGDLAHLLNLQGQRHEAFAMLDTLRMVNPVAAASIEVHLYADNGDISHALYVTETSDPPGSSDIAYYSIILGLHEEVASQDTRWQPVSLAVLGQRGEALAALEVALDEEENALSRMRLIYQTHSALGEYRTAFDALFRQWSRQNDEEAEPKLNFIDLMHLAAFMRELDETERLAPVLDEIGTHVERLTPLHAGAYDWLNGIYAMLRGNTEKSVRHFERIAQSGAPGAWIYGGPLWLFSAHPEFIELEKQFVLNRNAQIEDLERFRKTAITVEQLRDEYIAAN